MSKKGPSKNIKKVLIIGMAGGLAKLTTEKLTKKYPRLKICGVDSRDIDENSLPSNVEFIKIKYTRGNFEKLFREHQFDVVYHLARMSHSSANPLLSLSHRLDLNLMGTQRILDLSLRFGVKRVVILSTFHVYGALPDNPVFLKEDSTLRASIKYPELRDVVEMDQIATNWMWKNRDHVETIILRPSNVIGPRLNNTITNYLTSSYAPTGIDFNPMFQFVHEQDMANVLRSCFDKVEPGIYNVAPPDTISIRHAKQIASDGGVPTLLFAVEKMANIIKQLWDFPNYLIHYLMYPCIIDGESLNQQPIEPFQYTTHTALKSLQEIPKD